MAKLIFGINVGLFPIVVLGELFFKLFSLLLYLCNLVFPINGLNKVVCLIKNLVDLGHFVFFKIFLQSVLDPVSGLINDALQLIDGGVILETSLVNFLTL